MESYALTLTNLSRIVSLNKVNEKKPEMGPLKINGSINIAWTFPNGVIFILDIKSIIMSSCSYGYPSENIK